ncbi:MAG: hypothetical protein RXO76_08735 [Vulcanisaeta sp.]
MLPLGLVALHGYSPNDMVILGIAHRLGKPLLTFNERLRRGQGDLALRYLMLSC